MISSQPPGSMMKLSRAVRLATVRPTWNILPPLVKSASLSSDDVEIDQRLQRTNQHQIH